MGNHDRSRAIQELIEYERTCLERQASSHLSPVDLLPGLQHLIQMGINSVYQTGTLSSSLRRNIYRMFGSAGKRSNIPVQAADLFDQTTIPQICRFERQWPKSDGQRRRAFLSIRTVEYALHIWNAAHPTNPAVLLKLAIARKILSDSAFDPSPYYWPMHENADFNTIADGVLLAAQHTIDVAREDIDFQEDQEEGSDNGASTDVASLIAHTYWLYQRDNTVRQSGYSTDTIRVRQDLVIPDLSYHLTSHADSRDTFWYWWLLEGIPQAWHHISV